MQATTTTTAPTESMFIDTSLNLFRIGLFEDIAELMPYFEDKDKDLIHAAIGKCFHAYMQNETKMSVNFWEANVMGAFDKAHDIVADACFAPVERQDDESKLTKQFLIKLDQLTEYLNRQ
jgi:hypothetical protein